VVWKVATLDNCRVLACYLLFCVIETTESSGMPYSFSVLRVTQLNTAELWQCTAAYASQYAGEYVVVWRSGSALVSINKVNHVGPSYYWDGWPCVGLIPGAGHLFRYVTSHPGQLSLAIPSWIGTLSTSQRAVTSCGWGVKAGKVHLWVAGKTVWSSCYMLAICECFSNRA